MRRRKKIIVEIIEDDELTIDEVKEKANVNVSAHMLVIYLEQRNIILGLIPLRRK